MDRIRYFCIHIAKKIKWPIVIMLFLFSLNCLAKKEVQDFESSYRKLQLEYLRINKLYLEERLKNQELEKKNVERTEVNGDLESDLKYCEKDTTDFDLELDLTLAKLEKLEEINAKIKADYESLKKSCPLSITH